MKSIRLVENEILFYRSEGYLHLPGLISRAAAESMRAEVIQILNGLGISYDQLCRAETSKDKLRQSSQYLADTDVAALVNSAALRSVVEQLTGGPSTLYNPFTAVKSGGGGGQFHFHQDNQYTVFDGPGLNIWVALDEMTPENGCLQMMPRSHLQGDLAAVESSDKDGHLTIAGETTSFLPLRMMPGDAVAFTRLTVHGSGPNNTPKPRVAYAVQFHRNDVKAVWDNQPPRLLSKHNRWVKTPVSKIDPNFNPKAD